MMVRMVRIVRMNPAEIETACSSWKLHWKRGTRLTAILAMLLNPLEYAGCCAILRNEPGNERKALTLRKQAKRRKNNEKTIFQMDDGVSALLCCLGL